MAHIDFSPAPTVQPREAPPPDYQNIQTNPREFGAQVGAGAEKLGTGLTQAGQVYGQIAADEQVNHVITGLDDLNTKFQALKGKDALDQQPIIRQQMADLVAQARDHLGTADQALDFDRQVKFLYSRADREVGVHADQQQQVWGIGVNKAAADLSLNGVAKAAQSGDDAAVVNHTQDLINFRTKEAELTYGTDLSPEIRANVAREGTAESAKAQVMALLPTDPMRAAKVLDANSQYFNPLEYRALADVTQHATDKAQSDAIVRSIIGGGGGGGAGGQWRASPGAPIAGANAQEQQFLNEVRHRESGGNYSVTGPTTNAGDHYGAYQFDDHTWVVASNATGLGTQFVHAKDAPPAVQDANALWLYRNRGAAPWAASGPYPAAGGSPTEQGNIKLASTGPSPQTPMQQPVPGFPTREELTGRIPDGLSDEQYDRVYAGVTREYYRMVQATADQRAQVLAQYKGGMSMLQDGREFNIDEPKIRSLFPADTANEMVANLQDARTVGQQITAVRGMPLTDILSQQAANRAILANSTGETYDRQRRLSDAFDKAAETHIRALEADPAAYVGSTNPQIEVARQTMAAQTPDQAVAAHTAGQPTAAESYATKMLAEQDRLGVPPDEQHVISKITAPQMVQQITADPERAPAAIKTLQATWGSAWPEVWKDLTTVGKLPAAYQMVGALDNEGDGALLARALGQANKEGVNKPLDDLIDRGATGATRPSQVVRTRVEGSEAVQDYRSSMLASGASPEQVDGIVSSIGLLGQAKVLYHNEDPTAAGDEAVQSAIGQWDFLPNGGARIPRSNADAITDNAQRTVAGLSLAAVRPPAIYSHPGQAPGAATADDWMRVLQAAPNWVTVGQSIRLMDNGGRFVRAANGGFVEVPFNVQAAATAAAPAGTAQPTTTVAPF